MRGAVAILAVGLGLLGCDAGETEQLAITSPPAATLPPPLLPLPSWPSGVPFAVGGYLIAEDGHVVARFGLPLYEDAIALGGDRYHIDGHVIDAARGTTAPDADLTATDHGEWSATTELRRTAPDGTTRWSAAIRDPFGIRASAITLTGDRLVVHTAGELDAFDDATGEPRWHASGVDSAPVVGGDTLLYIGASPDGCWLVGRTIADGGERFRAKLPDRCDASLAVAGERALVSENASTRVYDLRGRELRRLDGGLVSAHAVGRELVLVLSAQIAGVAADGELGWQLGAPSYTSASGTAFADLPGGDLIIADYCARCDSDVEVQRISPATGRVAWHARVPGFRAGNGSGYTQYVYLLVRGEQLFVVSQADGHAFFEQLATATGERTRRCLEPEAACTPVGKR